MTSGVATRDDGVLGLEDDISGRIHEERAKGMVALFPRYSCELDRPQKMTLVCGSKRHGGSRTLARDNH